MNYFSKLAPILRVLSLWRSIPRIRRPCTASPSPIWSWGISTGPEAFPKGAGDGGTRGAARPGQRWASQDCGPRAQGPWATHGCGLLSAGCPAAVSREVAAGDSGDHLRDRHAGASTGWTSTIPRRAMSCERCRGGHSRRCSSSASCTPASRGSSRGWISGWIWARSGGWRRGCCRNSCILLTGIR